MRLIDADEMIKNLKAMKISYDAIELDGMIKGLEESKTVDAEPVITGETSDGYHTFNELYHHRAVLFSVIVKAFEDKAWKSRKHHDGTMYDGMFIVGVETPYGQATYHYDMEPYWEMFCCKEIERAPEWDGHTPAQAIERIGKLEPVRHGRWIFGEYDVIGYPVKCSECGSEVPHVNRDVWMKYDGHKYCGRCGAKMDGGEDDENA